LKTQNIFPSVLSMRTNGKVLHVGSELFFSFISMVMYMLSCAAACAFWVCRVKQGQF